MSEGKRIISMSHGSGGKLSHELITGLFLKKLNNPILAQLEDSAFIQIGDLPLVFTTDSYVVKPIFFPGGDIGKLAVYGTVNDISVMGARPLFLSCGFIIEEGMDYTLLEKIVDSISAAAEKARVKIVTGDTKVVERGSGDGLFINTSGVGIIENGVHLGIGNIKVGDKIILSGTLGDHGIAVLSCREGFNFQSEIVSDSAPLWDMVSGMLKISRKIRFMRDPTRGGLGTLLNEVALGSSFCVMIEEAQLPVREDVRSLCEIIGIDPIYVANEGKLVAIVAPDDAEAVLKVMKGYPEGIEARLIGEITEEHKGKVCLATMVGGLRIIDMFVGDQLPRIC